MQLIQASAADKNQLHHFLKSNGLIQLQEFSQDGYVVEHEGKIIGCFELASVDEATYWLKKLFIIRSEALQLPLVLEFILQFAIQKNAKAIYARSNQPVTDLLLESLCFSLQTDEIVVGDFAGEGKWWTYHVS